MKLGTDKLPSKEEIRKEAERGAFDLNPLLGTPHEIECNSCGCRHKVIYLDYLKSGRFDIGHTEIVELFYAAPPVSGLRRTQERITPLVVTIECTRCGTKKSCSPISLEYLLATSRKKVPNIYF